MSQVTNEPSRPFSWPVRVYIEDTDAGGIVFYVNYLKYMERARTEFLRHIGFDHAQLIQHGVMFVIHSVDIKYDKPARLDNALSVTVEVAELRRTNLVFKQNVLNADTGETYARAMVRGVYVTRSDLKPCRIPAEIAQALDAQRECS